MMPARRALRHICALAATFALLASAFAGPASAAQPPIVSAEERARAIAQPSVLFVEYHATGFVRDKATAEQISPDPVVVSVRCSGFIVSPTGVGVTLKACVVPREDELIRWAVEAYANAKNLGSGERNQLASKAIFTGEAPTEAPTVRLFAQMNTATAGQTASPAWPVEVLSLADSKTGLSVVKVGQQNLPAVEVVKMSDPAHLLAVTSPTAYAYAPANGKTMTIRSRRVDVAEQRTGGTGDLGLTFKIDQELPWESRGGLVADTDGRAVAMTALDPEGKVRSVYSAEAIAAELAAAGAKNELGSNDVLYRRALDDYFGGRYSDALKKFNTVLQAAPMNETAAAYRKQAEDRKDTEQGSGTGVHPLLIVAVVLAAGILACLVLLVVVLMRSRRRPAATPVSVSPFDSAYTYPISSPPGYPVSGAPSSGVPSSGVPSSGNPFPGFPSGGPAGYQVPAPQPYQGDATHYEGTFIEPYQSSGPPHTVEGGNWPAQPRQDRPDEAGR